MPLGPKQTPSIDRADRGHAPLLDRRLHLFTGKGGVGKSTLVVALGLELARRGKRPLVVELGHRASVESIVDHGLGGVPLRVGYEPIEIAPGLFATNMDLHASIAGYIGHHLKVRALGSLALRSRTLRRFFEVAPGVAEVATLHRLRALLGELGDGPSFDPVLVDLDATGHARMFFELPKVFSEIAESGPLRLLLDRISALLRDPSRTALHIVTTPGELPVQETVELYADLCADPAVQLGALLVNMVPPRSPYAAAALEPEPDARATPNDATHGGPARAADLALARRALAGHRRAEALMRRLESEIDLPQITLPRLAAARVGNGALEALGAAIARGLDAASEARS